MRTRVVPSRVDVGGRSVTPALAVLAVALMSATAPFGRSAEPLGPFSPSAARVWDREANHRYVWRDQCHNNNADHRLAGGYEWTDDSRGFLAFGSGWVGEEFRPGLMMLAFPDGNVLHAEWKVTIPEGKWLRIRYSLTNQAAASSTNGLKFTVTAADKHGKRHTVLEQMLPRGDSRLYVKDFRPAFPVEAITFTHDNLGQECWDVLWLYPEITDAVGPETTEIVRASPAGPSALRPVDGDSLRRAIEDLIRTFGQRYPDGQQYLDRLTTIEGLTGDERVRQLEALQFEALKANPLVSDQPILFVTRHQYRSHYHAIDTLFHTGEFNPDRGIMHADLFQGGGSMKTIDMRTGEIETLVTVPEGVARDPDVHFDARRIVFAMRRNKAEDYHIFECDVDSGDLRQLTSAEGVCDHPGWQGDVVPAPAGGHAGVSSKRYGSSPRGEIRCPPTSRSRQPRSHPPGQESV